MRRRGFTLIELLVVLFGIVILAAILIPIFHRARQNTIGPKCVLQIRQLSLATLQYVQDSNGAFPAVAVPNLQTYGWADTLYPYVRDSHIFQCPSEKSLSHQPNPRLSGYTDYWYNANLASLKQTKLRFAFKVLLFGDGNDGQELTDARYVKYSLSPDWYNDKSKPSFRHLDGAYYAFADGHVKWLKSSEVTVNAPAKSNFTFLPK